MNIKKCPVCDVEIDNDIVLFKYGGNGTKERLYARVCQYAIKKGRTGCINQQVNLSNCSQKDFYYDISRLDHCDMADKLID